MNQEINNRANDRIKTNLMIYLLTNNGENEIAYLSDISQEGMCVRTSHLREKGSQINVNIHFPNSFHNPTDVSAEVVLCEKISDNDWSLHTKFNLLESDAMNKIETFIALKKNDKLNIIKSSKITFTAKQMEAIIKSITPEKTVFPVSLKGLIMTDESFEESANIVKIGISQISFQVNKKIDLNKEYLISFQITENYNRVIANFIPRKIIFLNELSVYYTKGDINNFSPDTEIIYLKLLFDSIERFYGKEFIAEKIKNYHILQIYTEELPPGFDKRIIIRVKTKINALYYNDRHCYEKLIIEEISLAGAILNEENIVPIHTYLCGAKIRASSRISLNKKIDISFRVLLNNIQVKAIFLRFLYLEKDNTYVYGALMELHNEEDFRFIENYLKSRKTFTESSKQN